jgi:hypothetical protein
MEGAAGVSEMLEKTKAGIKPKGLQTSSFTVPGWRCLNVGPDLRNRPHLC